MSADWGTTVQTTNHNQRRSMPAGMLLLLIGVIGVVLWMAVAQSNSIPSHTVATPSRGNAVGDNATTRSLSVLCYDLAGMVALVSQAQKSDTSSFEVLLKTGRCIPLDPGTRIQIVDVRVPVSASVNATRVTVLSGAASGTTGLVLTDSW